MTRPAPSTSDAEQLLLDWHRTARRDLPWRRTNDPWAVLVSEIMLQQTQVARVIERWTEWMQRWPDPADLAAEDRAEVIRAWSGLGYNRRAVNLHRAAQVIAESGWPEDFTDLPGVGRYTADAVARFALKRSVLPVDVNIGRVLERSAANFTPEAAEALMDLGATVCIARQPRCEECPLVSICPARGQTYAPLRKQSKFEGSFRQRRAQTLRAIMAGQPDPHSEEPEVMASLIKDGLL
jgi:A/G-specific adenine glycosylase